MENNKAKIAKLARASNLYRDDYEKAQERTLKTAAISAKNRKLYLDGYSKGLQKIPFDSFTDLIEYNGQMIKRKEHPGFRAGYTKGLNESASLVENSNKTR